MIQLQKEKLFNGDKVNLLHNKNVVLDSIIVQQVDEVNEIYIVKIIVVLNKVEGVKVVEDHVEVDFVYYIQKRTIVVFHFKIVQIHKEKV